MPDNKITIDQDKDRLDIDMIHEFLQSAYWAQGRTLTEVKRSIINSICFGVYIREKQIGFARVVSDFTIFGYIMDVFILKEYRGKGYGMILMNHIVNESTLHGVQNWMLATSDAHGLYSKIGFQSIPNPEKIMSKKS